MTPTTGFKFNGAYYTTSENGYYYKTIEGKTVRIKEAEYDEAYVAAMDRVLETIGVAVDELPDIAPAREAKEDTEEAVEEEAVLEIDYEPQVQEKPKRKPTKRTPKSVGFRETYNEFGNIEVILTEKQVDFIKHLADTCYWVDVESAIWVDCLCDEIGGQFAGKPMTVGAMISTLCEKGLGKRGKDRVNGKKCTSFALTELGREVALDLGL